MEIKLRKARPEDAEFILELRNEEEARKASIIDQDVISKRDHVKWFQYNFFEFQIIQYKNKDVGYLRIGDNNFIGMVILKEFRNIKIGQEILKNVKGYCNVRLENKISLSCFKKAGFKIIAYNLEKK